MTLEIEGSSPPSALSPDFTEGGRIVENIVHFVRLLRASGLPVGTGQAIEATEAVMAAGIISPKRLYWTLQTVLVKRPAEREIFSQAFAMFWRDPAFMQQMLAMMMPEIRVPGKPDRRNDLARRVSEAMAETKPQAPRGDDQQIEIRGEASYAFGQVDRQKDFEQMSAEELRRARSEIARMRLPLEEIRTRRFQSARQGEQIDLRRMLRAMGAHGPDHLLLRYRRRRWRRPPLVVICDISGSMDSYARIFLHFLYALTNDRDRVHAFLFGTRLRNVTRELKNRDPDLAIARIGREVTDWAGGTRIGHCLDQFNRHWARRVLGQNAMLLLFTDGLDRDGGEGLERAARRLKASSRRLVWLNPLMRYDRYEPIAAGARVLATYASETRSCHNLNSLADLTRALSAR